jgi:DNA-binding response OmpR family regulator
MTGEPGIPARLLALADDVQPGDVALDSEACSLGRAATCRVVIARPMVSRLHAVVAPEGPRYLLRDAGSANGTFVNGERLAEPRLLADGDALGLGSPAPVLRFVDPDPTVVPAARLRYDERGMRFVLAGQPLELTPNEFRLLRHLFAHAGALCPREACAAAIWGADYPPGYDADTLDRVVSTLRGKLRRLAPTDELIQTRPALGYLLLP